MRIDEVRRIENASAALALIASRPLIATIRARADHVAIRKEAAVVLAVYLFCHALFDEARLPQRFREVLRHGPVLRR